VTVYISANTPEKVSLHYGINEQVDGKQIDADGFDEVLPGEEAFGKTFDELRAMEGKQDSFEA
jgi:hypothetical protein